MKPRRLQIAELEAVPLVDPTDADSVQVYLTGWLVGSLMRADLPLDITVECHGARDRLLPSFTVYAGPHRLVVHVEKGIA